jgi:hypothetical protein
MRTAPTFPSRVVSIEWSKTYEATTAPPEEWPTTTMRRGSPPKRAAFALSQATVAPMSSDCAGHVTAGASR